MPINYNLMVGEKILEKQGGRKEARCFKHYHTNFISILKSNMQKSVQSANK